MVLTSLGHGNAANTVAIQADGKIVVAGGTDGAGGPSGMDVVRYHPDGTLDRSFGGDGTVDYDFGFYADNPVPTKIVLLQPRTGEASERILIGGHVSEGGPLSEARPRFLHHPPEDRRLTRRVLRRRRDGDGGQ
jgi:hypothetical protein